jgi:peptidoglycan/LPS O-acetylase OafA/YrhL
MGERAALVLTPGQTDSLGIGAWLALRADSVRDGMRDGGDHVSPMFGYQVSHAVLAAALALFGIASLTSLASSTASGAVGRALALALRGFGISLAFGWLVVGAARGFGGLPGRVLETRSLVYTGRISYGIYLYHVFAIWGFSQFGVSLRTVPFPAYFTLLTLASIAAASASWHLLELPLIQLKRYLPEPAHPPRSGP